MCRACRRPNIMPTQTSDLVSGLNDWIKDEAKHLGFDQARITSAAILREQGHHTRLSHFLDNDHHGTMDWMATRVTERADPQSLWAGAQSVIMLGLAYTPDHDPLTALEHQDRGTISVYARGADYHDLIKKKLKQLARGLIDKAAQMDEACEVKVFVDTAPVMEKPLGAAAGLGWQGKHTNLVSRELGNWFFLGAIYTSLSLPPDEGEDDHCGRCTACQDICPTKAFPAPYQLDARRCISYLTIEHKGQIDREFRPLMGNRIYGCDDCLAICPWNKFAATAREAKLFARPELSAPQLRDLVQLGDAAFRDVFRGSPIKRVGRDRFVRNVLIAIGNSGQADFIPTITPLLKDDAAIVRGMAVWALRQIADPDRLRALRAAHQDREQDPSVLAEWTD